MDIVEWGVFIIYAVFFNLGWIKGCRDYLRTKGGVTHQSVATTMLMTIVSIIFLVSNINKLHLIWITPLLILTSPLNSIIFSIPLLGQIYRMLSGIFFSIITYDLQKNGIPDVTRSDAAYEAMKTTLPDLTKEEFLKIADESEKRRKNAKN